MPAFQENTREKLQSFLPEEASIENPVDMIGGAKAKHYASALEAVLPDETVYLNDTSYSLETFNIALQSLPEELKEELSSVVIEGDMLVSYDLMIRVLDILRHNGFSGINLRLREAND